MTKSFTYSMLLKAEMSLQENLYNRKCTRCWYTVISLQKCKIKYLDFWTNRKSFVVKKDKNQPPEAF